MFAAIRRDFVALGLTSRKEWQGQNHPSGFVLYRHHQGRIVVQALFSQLYDFALGIGKCRCDIGQICTMRVILNTTRSAYCEVILRHPNAYSARSRLPPDCLFSCVMSCVHSRQSTAFFGWFSQPQCWVAHATADCG
jgi:hypothetical protein